MSHHSVLVITAALVYFSLVLIWRLIFKKKWMLAWEIASEEMTSKDPTPYLISFIGTLWSSYGVFLILKHIQPKNFTELIAVSLGLWLFIFVGMGAKHYAFAQRSLKAFMLDYGVDLIGLFLVSAILWKHY